jgi:hypothetical protein
MAFLSPAVNFFYKLLPSAIFVSSKLHISSHVFTCVKLSLAPSVKLNLG